MADTTEQEIQQRSQTQQMGYDWQKRRGGWEQVREVTGGATKPPPITQPSEWRKVSPTEYIRTEASGSSRTNMALRWNGRDWVRSEQRTMYDPSTGQVLPPLPRGQVYTKTARGMTVSRVFAGGAEAFEKQVPAGYTGIAGNVGYVVTETGETEYNPEVYSSMAGHSGGYYGFKGYRGETGVDVPLREDYEQLNAKEQFVELKEKGYIPAGAEFVVGEGKSWTYVTPEARQKVYGELEDWLKTTAPEELKEAYREGGLEAVPQAYIDYYNKQVEQLREASRDNIQEFAQEKNIVVGDVGQPTVDEMTKLIVAGMSPQSLAAAGVDVGGINAAIDAVNAKAEVYQFAIAKLGAGEQTIQSLAAFQRANPDDRTTISDAFGEDVSDKVSEYNRSSGELISYLDRGVIWGDVTLSGGELSAIGRALSQLGVKPKDGSSVEAWRNLDDDTKHKAAQIIVQDPFKGNMFASLGADIDILAEEGLGFRLLLGPIQPITHVVAKQTTLPEARRILAENYSKELDAVRNYIKDDGTVDIKRLESETGGEVKSRLVGDLGYDNFEDLKTNLEYYNNGVRVTGKEWTTAGLVGALDVLMVGGAGALAGLGTVGRVTAGAIPIGAGLYFIPDSFKAIRSPDVSMPEKILAGAIPVMLIGGGAVALKGTPPSPFGRVRMPVKGEIVRAAEVAKITPEIQQAVANQLAKVDTVSKIARVTADLKRAGELTLETARDLPKVTQDLIRIALNDVEYAAGRFVDAVKAAPSLTAKAVRDAIDALKLATKKAIDVTKDLPHNVKVQLGKAIEGVDRLASEARLFASEGAKIAVNDIEYALIRLENAIRVAPSVTSKIVTDALDELRLVVDRGVTVAKELPSQASQRLVQSVDRLNIAVADMRALASMSGRVVLNDLSYAVNELMELLKATPDYASAAFRRAISNVEGAVFRAKVGMREVPGAIAEKVMASIDVLEKTVADVKNTIKDVRTTASMTARVALNDVVYVVDRVLEVARTAPEALGRTAGEAIKDISLKLKSAELAASMEARVILTDIQYTLQRLADAAKATPELATKLVSSAVNDLRLAQIKATELLRSLPEDVADVLKRATERLEAKASELRLLTSEGLRGALNDIVYAVDEAVYAIKSAPKVTVELLDASMKKMGDAVFRAKTAVKDLPVELRDAWAGSLGAVEKVIGKIKQDVKLGVALSQDAVSVGLNEISYQVDRMVNALKESPAKAQSTIQDALLSAKVKIKRLPQDIEIAKTDYINKIKNDIYLAEQTKPVYEGMVEIQGKVNRLAKLLEQGADDVAVTAALVDINAALTRLQNVSPELAEITSMLRYQLKQVTTPESPLGTVSPDVWAGVKLGDNPVVGVSRGKVVVGAKGIELPPVEQWKLPGDIDYSLGNLEKAIDVSEIANKNAVLDAVKGLRNRVEAIRNRIISRGDPSSAVDYRLKWQEEVGTPMVEGFSKLKEFNAVQTLLKSSENVSPEVKGLLNNVKDAISGEGQPFEPRLGIEKNVIINREAYEKAGMSEESAATLAERQERLVSAVAKWYGKEFPVVPELLTKPIDTLSAESVEALLKYIARTGDKVASVKVFDRWFGSGTIPAQLSKEALAEWEGLFGRVVGDFDIKLKNVDVAGAAEWVRGANDAIKAVGKDPVSITEANPTQIMSRSLRTGLPKKALEAHFEGEELPSESSSQFEMAYGFKKLSPAVKVKLKGIGDIRISRLSETGVGKLEQVGGMRRNPVTGETELAIEAHRYPKDIIDFYEIDKTGRSPQEADALLNLLGYDKKALMAQQRAVTQSVVDAQGSMTDAVNTLTEVKKGLEAGIDNAKIQDGLLKARGSLARAQRYVKDMPQVETRVAYDKATQAIDDLGRLVDDVREGKLEPSAMRQRLSDIVFDVEKPVGRGLWEIDSLEYARPSDFGTAPPVFEVLSPALLSVATSRAIGVTSEGNVVTAPMSIFLESSKVPKEYPSVAVSSGVSSEPSSGIASGFPSEVSVIPSEIPSVFPSEISAIPSSIPSSIPSEIPSEISSIPSEISSIPSSIPSSISSIPSEIPSELTEVASPPSAVVPIRGGAEYQEQVAKIKPGTVSWIQGRPTATGGGTAGMYKVLPPPYRQEDLFTMRESPPGYDDRGWSGKGMAKESLQVIGGDLADNVENVDLGWARINIRMEGGKPEIEYVHDVEANVGERSRTIGLGEGQIPPEMAKEVQRTEGVSATEIRQKREVYIDPLIHQSDTLVKQPILAEQQSLVTAEATLLPNAKQVEEKPEEKPEDMVIQAGSVVVNPMQPPSAALVKPSNYLIPEEQALVGGGNRLMAEAAALESGESDEEGFPRKKPKNLKNWWDAPYYRSRAERSIPVRTYYGHKLLPPDLGGEL